MEISLALFVILFAAGFALVYWVLRLVIHTLRMPAYVASFRRRQRVTRSIEALRGALLAYFEGRFGKSEKLASRAFELGESPPLAAMLAARSAHFLRDPVRRDAWLARAESAAPDARVARLTTQAELLLDERRFEEAKQVLTELHSNGPRHVVSLRLLMRAEQGLQNWEEVLRIARQLEKRSAVTPEFARQMEVTATVESLKRRSLSSDEVRQVWKTVTPGLQRERRVAATAARLFMRLGDCRTAHAIVRTALDQQWDDELVRLYGECAAGDSLERLDQAEKWLEQHPRDPALLLTLGRLCLERELWGKAQSYLEASVSESPSRDAHLELARLFDRLERESDAARHYRAAADVGMPA